MVKFVWNVAVPVRVVAPGPPFARRSGKDTRWDESTRVVGFSH